MRPRTAVRTQPRFGSDFGADTDEGSVIPPLVLVSSNLTPTEVRSAIELVRKIHASGITLVIVEHIMEVIVSLTSRVIVFHQGKEIARGSPQEVTRNERVIEAYLGRRQARQMAGGKA